VEDIFSPDHLTEVLISGVAPEAQGPAAAVAAVARKGKLGAELLFIERSTKKDDPWSGQMAFPGGRASDNDHDSLATAVRETNEELGIDLVDSLLLGRLSDVEGGPRGTRQRLTVTPYVFWISGQRPMSDPNHEVAGVIWVPVSELLEPNRYVEYFYPPLGPDSWPGITVEGERVIWGLTLRMLIDLFRRLGQPLPIRS
jgi:8-oxo-dGTP pyrophosphatase MutT (NUDIX family)